MVEEMGSRRNIAIVVLLLVVGGLFWQFLSGSSGAAGNQSDVGGLVREAPAKPDAEEPRATEALPELKLEREVAAPQELAPEPDSEPTKAVVATRGIFGRVTSKGGDPVPGREVLISFMGPMGGNRFASATTDVDGNYAALFDLGRFVQLLKSSRSDAHAEWIEWAKEVVATGDPIALQSLSNNRRNVDNSAWLEVAVIDSGLKAQKRIDLVPGMPEQSRVDLRLEPRSDLEGQVLGAGGVVAGASILLFDGDWVLHGTALSDASGNFQMNGPPPGRYVLHARLPGVGAGQVAGNFVGGALRAPFQTILLGGMMKLGGEVVNPKGDPIVGLPLTAIIDTLAQETEDVLWPTPSELAQAESLGALCFSETTTGGKGVFAFTAMEAGNYRIRFENVAERYQPEGLFFTGTDHRILFSACLLNVSLKGKAEDTMDVRVHCVALGESPTGVKQERNHLVREWGFGSASFIVEPGRLWQIYAERDGKRQGQAFERIQEGDYKTLVVLEIGPWGSKGERIYYSNDPPPPVQATLQVELTGEKGKSYEGLITLRNMASSGDRPVFERQRMRGEGFTGLDKGLYRLRVEAAADSRPFLPLDYPGSFSLHGAKPRTVKLKVTEGGRLRVKIVDAKGSIVRGVTAHLVPEAKDLPQIPLSFALKSNEQPAPVLPVGEDYAPCTPVVPAGSYTLVVRGAGQKTIIPDRKVEFEAGETLNVSIDLP